MKAQVLLGVDNTNLSEATAPLTKAVELASALDGELTIVHVVGHDRLSTLRSEQPEEFRFTDVVFDNLHADLKRGFEQAFPVGAITAHIRVTDGNPGEKLVEVAESREADYLVIGLRNRSRVGKFLLGSTAQQILLASTRPVVAVPL